MEILQGIYSRRHPICHHKWSTVVPADCEAGDNIGKVSYLYTHADFYKLYWPYAPDLEHEDYLYEIVGGNSDGAFAIDADGELTVNNPANFTADRTITVRVKVFDWYYNDCVCTIRRIPVEDCIYFDGVSGGNGTRSNPYSTFASVVGTLGNGEAGKSYFWKRGVTYTNEWSKIWQPDINAPYINFAGWGQGSNQKIDLSQNLTSQRFVDIGTSLEGTWEENTCHNFRMYDFEFTHDMSNTVFPVNGNPYGKNWEIHRLKCENTTYSNGFLWFIGVFSVGFIDKNLEISDIQTSNSTSRQVKFECGGVKGWNFKCWNEVDSGALVSATTHPFVELKYIHYTNIHASNPNNTAFGMNLRARGHSVEWAVFKITGWPMVLMNLGSSEGQGPNYNIDETCYFRNIIIDYCDAQSLNHAVNQTTGNTINGARFENIYSRTSRPMWSNGTAENLKFTNVFLKSTITYGFRIWGSSGGNATPTITNCTILGFTNPVHCESGMEATLINSVYDGTISGTVHETSNSTNTSDFQDEANDNYRLEENSSLVDAGTYISGQDTDIVEVDRPEGDVSIGAFQFINEPLDGPIDFEPETNTLSLTASPSGGGTVSQDPEGPHLEGANVTATATPNQGWEFDRWEDSQGPIAGAGAVYAFQMPGDDLSLTAYFTEISEPDPDPDPDPENVTVSLNHSPFASGNLSGGGIYPPGTVITLIAEPNPGWTFLYWMLDGQVLSTNEEYQYTVPTEDVNILGYFESTGETSEPGFYNVSLISDKPNQGSVSGAGTFEEGEEVTVTATPTLVSLGARFLFWKKDDEIVSYDAAYTFNMPGEDILLIAHFELSNTTPAAPMAMVRDIVQESYFPSIPSEGIVEMEAVLEFEQNFQQGGWVPVGEYLNPYKYDQSRVDFQIDRAMLGKMAFHRPDITTNDPEITSGIVHRYRMRTQLMVDGLPDGSETLHTSKFAWLAGRPYLFPDENPYEGKAYLFLTTRPMQREIHSGERLMLYVLPLELGLYTLEEKITYRNTRVEIHTRSLGNHQRYQPFYFRYTLPSESQAIVKVELRLTGRDAAAEVLTLIPRPTPQFPLQLLYGNSLGGFDSFFCSGKKELGVNTQGERFETSLQPGHDRQEGTVQVYNQRAWDAITLRTGYISLEERKALKDMQLRNHIYLVAENKLQKLILDNTEMQVSKDGTYIHAAEFSARFAHENHSSYGRDPRQ
jgi:hypothetical protein